MNPHQASTPSLADDGQLGRVVDVKSCRVDLVKVQEVGVGEGPTGFFNHQSLRFGYEV